jgi:thiamine biosynthesis lipoprotein
LRRHEQQGVLLGAEARIRAYHHDAASARSAIDACFAEARRLESIFSLHRPDSALSRLNRAGRLSDPPPELVALLDQAAAFSRATGGAFDVTVQPLWALYADHFAAHAAGTDGPSRHEIRRALACVDYRAVEVSAALVRLIRPGMAVTLNGIAQGFITDHVTRLLRARGFDNVLVDMGEFRAVGAHADGSPWRVAIADPDRPWRSFATLPLADRAIATSGGYGTRFDAAGRHHHLFDPRTGRSAAHYRSVSVLAPDATTADALSTGLCALAPEAARAVVDARQGVSAIFIDTDGSAWTAGSPPLPARA